MTQLVAYRVSRVFAFRLRFPIYHRFRERRCPLASRSFMGKARAALGREVLTQSHYQDLASFRRIPRATSQAIWRSLLV